MKNLENRLKVIEDKIIPKTTLFRFCARLKSGQIVILKQYPMKRFKNHDVFNLIAGESLFPEEDILEGRSKFGLLSDENIS